MERPKTIGVFAGLLFEDGDLLLQVRTEKGSIYGSKDTTYQYNWELPGGKVKENDAMKALTLEVLGRNLVREVKEELGIKITQLPYWPALYLAIFVNKEKGINDWAFMIPIIPVYWVMPKSLKREIIKVDVDKLTELANNPSGRGQLVSGFGKRMHRMSLGALYKNCMFNEPNSHKAKVLLNQIKPDWYQTEYSDDAEEFLARLREAIK